MQTREPSRFLRWYLSSMRSFVPQWANAIFLGHPMARTCRFVDGERTNRSGTLPLDHLTGVKQPVAMRFRRSVDAVLPESLFLTRNVSMPRKAAARMLQIGTFDLLQKTPFQADEIVWAIGPVHREKEQVHMTQVVALRDDIQTWRNRMEAANRPLRRIYANIKGRKILVARFEQESVHLGRFWSIMNATGATIALACAIYLWALPGLQATKKIALLEPEIAHLQAEALALREDLENRQHDQDLQHGILSEISEAPHLLDAMVAATVALPDSAWVSNYVFDANGVRMFTDINGSAVDLLYDLSDNGILPNALMQGDVQRTSAGTEEFWLLHDHIPHQ